MNGIDSPLAGSTETPVNRDDADPPLETRAHARTLDEAFDERDQNGPGSQG